MNYKAVIFDLDGTLLDTLDDLADAGNAALEALRLPQHPTDSYRYFVGDGMRTLIERILPSGSAIAQVAECENLFIKKYADHWADKTRKYDGIENMLKNLHAMNLKLAILSNKPDNFTRICVDHFFAGGRFALVRGQVPGVPKKPDPAGAMQIAADLELSTKDILYVGDTSIDMLTGTRAGMTTAGVTWGFRTVDELKKSGARFIVNDPQEIVGICR